jgi:hypothetical protein
MRMPPLHSDPVRRLGILDELKLDREFEQRLDRESVNKAKPEAACARF